MIRKHSYERQLEYDEAYMNMALAISKLSHAVRKKVGSILVSPDDQVVAQGYNGMPAGFDNNCEREWCDVLDGVPDTSRCEIARVNGITCGECELHTLKTRTEVLHAESNAIAKCARSSNSSEGCTMYVTMSPCINCAKSIIQAGIRKVVYLEDYDKSEGVELLRRAGIEVVRIDDPGTIHVEPRK